MTLRTRSNTLETVPLLTQRTLAHQRGTVPHLSTETAQTRVSIPVLTLRTADAMASVPVQSALTDANFALLVPYSASIAVDTSRSIVILIYRTHTGQKLLVPELTIGTGDTLVVVPEFSRRTDALESGCAPYLAVLA